MSFLGVRWETFLGRWATTLMSLVTCCILQQNKSRKDREGRAVTQNIPVIEFYKPVCYNVVILVELLTQEDR